MDRRKEEPEKRRGWGEIEREGPEQV